MIDPTSTTPTELETRLPAAYSQGFAHVRIVTAINPDDPGPLGGADLLDIAFAAEDDADSARRSAAGRLRPPCRPA